MEQTFFQSACFLSKYVCLPVFWLSVCVFVFCLSACLFCVSTFCLLSVCLYACLSNCLYVCLLTFFSVFHLFSLFRFSVSLFLLFHSLLILVSLSAIFSFVSIVKTISYLKKWRAIRRERRKSGIRMCAHKAGSIWKLELKAVEDSDKSGWKWRAGREREREREGRLRTLTCFLHFILTRPFGKKI